MVDTELFIMIGADHRLIISPANPINPRSRFLVSHDFFKLHTSNLYANAGGGGDPLIGFFFFQIPQHRRAPKEKINDFSWNSYRSILLCENFFTQANFDFTMLYRCEKP